MHALKQIKTIALVGASQNPDRASYRVMEFLLEKGFKVIPVSPMLKGELLGQKSYASLADIPHSVDMIDIFRQSEAVLEVVEEALALKPKLIWMQLGVINDEAKSLAEKHGIKVIMDKCPKIEWGK